MEGLLADEVEEKCNIQGKDQHLKVAGVNVFLYFCHILVSSKVASSDIFLRTSQTFR